MIEKNLLFFLIILIHLLSFYISESENENGIINNIIKNYDKKLEIFTVATSKQGIFISSYGDNNTIIIFNFDNNNKELIFNEIATTNLQIPGINNELLSITINNSLNHYFLSCFYYYCDLINYDNSEIQNFNVFGEDKIRSIISIKNPLFKLNDNYNFFYGIILRGVVYGDLNYLLMSKIHFIFNEINISFDIIYEKKYLNESTYALKDQDILSCFQTEKNIIECLVINREEHLNIFIFDEFLEYKNWLPIDSDNSVDISKCIHLQKEIGVYNYLYYRDETFIPSLKIKELDYNE